MEKTEDLIGRMRWKTYHFFNQGTSSNRENYGFKTQKTPPHNKLLESFENDLLGTIKNITFRNNISKYQRNLMNMVDKINKSDNVFVKADKTNNIYEMNYKEYDQLVNKNLQQNYNKTEHENSQEKVINEESKKITDKLKISDRVGKLAKKES